MTYNSYILEQKFLRLSSLLQCELVELIKLLIKKIIYFHYNSNFFTNATKKNVKTLKPTRSKKERKSLEISGRNSSTEKKPGDNDGEGPGQPARVP